MYMTVESERFRDQLLHELREAAAGHALDDLADEIPVGQAVVARAGAGLVVGRGVLDRMDHVVPVEHALGTVDHAPDVMQSRLVRQDRGAR